MFGVLFCWCCKQSHTNLLEVLITKYHSQLRLKANRCKDWLDQLPSIQVTDAEHEHLHDLLFSEELANAYHKDIIVQGLSHMCFNHDIDTAGLALRLRKHYVCDHLLTSAVAAGAHEIVELILSKYKDLVHEAYIMSALGKAFDAEDSEMASLFLMHLSDEVLKRAGSIDRFNTACELGQEFTVRHMLEYRKDLFKLDDLAFHGDSTSRQAKIVDLLHKAYGDALFVRYPLWLELARSKDQER